MITVPSAVLHIIYLLCAINCCKACVETWRDVPSAELVPWGVYVGERWKENEYAREQSQEVDGERERERKREGSVQKLPTHHLCL